MLRRRWCEPTLTCNWIAQEGKKGHTTLPCTTKAHIGVRYVADQTVDQIVHAIEEHVLHEHAKFRSPNEVTVTPTSFNPDANWWLASTECSCFAAAEYAIEQVWKIAPTYTREGGTVPNTNYLERVFKAPALHLPLGQSTDNAHLPNVSLDCCFGVLNVRDCFVCSLHCSFSFLFASIRTLTLYRTFQFVV